MKDCFWCISSCSGELLFNQSWNSKIRVGRQAHKLMRWTWEGNKILVQILVLVQVQGYIKSCQPYGTRWWQMVLGADTRCFKMECSWNGRWVTPSRTRQHLMGVIRRSHACSVKEGFFGGRFCSSHGELRISGTDKSKCLIGMAYTLKNRMPPTAIGLDPG